MMPKTGFDTPLQQYRQNQIATASPHQLLLMLFDGALRFVHQAAEALEKKDYNTANLVLCRAQKIIGELMASLDFNQGKIAVDLFKIYEYLYHRL